MSAILEISRDEGELLAEVLLHVAYDAPLSEGVKEDGRLKDLLDEVISMFKMGSVEAQLSAKGLA